MVYLVYGSPCSGKTTYIKDHAKRGDLICDVDYIYGALSNDDPHDAELHLHDVACKLDLALKKIIHDRDGRWCDAYVVSIANTRDKLKYAMDQVNADEAIYIDTPYEECMRRAEERPFYFRMIIEEWFATRDL